MDSPAVSEFRLVRLPLKRRANFGDWLNVLWNDRGGAAVLALGVISLRKGRRKQ